MNCSEKKNINAYYLNELTDSEREHFEAHIQVCKECGNAVQALFETRNILSRHQRPAPPRHLARDCIRAIETMSSQSTASTVNEKWYERWLQPVPRLQWAAAVVVFCAGLLLGKVIFSPAEETRYPLSVYHSTQEKMDPRQVRNYLLGVEMLLLDLSNLEYPSTVDSDEWTMQLQIAEEMLLRTHQVKQFTENRNPTLYHLLVEIEWILQDVAGTPSMEMADMASYIRGSIEENQLLSKLHQYLS